MRITGLVGDDKADGSCARVEVRIRVQCVSDSNETYRTCGNGTTAHINFYDIDTSTGLVGSIQPWSVRVCVGTACTAFRDYRP
jgi:hypothetical protein